VIWFIDLFTERSFARMFIESVDKQGDSVIILDSRNKIISMIFALYLLISFRYSDAFYVMCV